MTLDEAIEILTKINRIMTLDKCLDEGKAVQLGIEALKRVISCRGYTFNPMRDELPSETED